jgi:GR25 family glycosyltransferase involved in LPS biosynthesis
MRHRIYCIHHTDNRSRKRRLLKRFDELGLEVEWIETYHPRERASWDHDGLSADSIGETSCGLKHRDVLRRQLIEDIDVAVVLEDDIDLPDTFRDDLDRYLREFEELGGDLLMIGTAFDMHVPAVQLEPGRSVYVAPSHHGRACHAYAVTLDAARVLVPGLEHMPQGFGHDVNDLTLEHELKMCWVEPGLEQLTLTGEMLSSIETRRTWESRKALARRRFSRLLGRR